MEKSESIEERYRKQELLPQASALRSSNLELYRILVMLLIIAHHYVVNSGLLAASGPVFSAPLSARSLFLLLFGMWGKTGINCFVLITGYFMCKSRITLKKFLKLVLEVEFYRIVIYIILLLTGANTFTISECIKVIFPVTSAAQNFTGCYLLFFLFIPFLNILIHHLTEKQHLLLILLCLFMYTFLGTVAKSVDMNYVSWFIVLYFIASYLRLYPKKVQENTVLWGVVTASLVVISMLSVVCIEWLAVKLGKVGSYHYWFVSDSNSILALACAVSSFLFFTNLKMKNSKVINTVAASTFGVLLIHTHSAAFRSLLWGKFLRNVEMVDSGLLYVHAFLSVIGIFAVCTVIDYLRIRLIEKPFFALLEKKKRI